MKKLLQIPLLLVALFLTSIPLSAHDFEVDGIYYNITSSTDMTVEVTYRGGSYLFDPQRYTDVVTIPSTVTYDDTNYSVTEIGRFAFYDCSGLISVAIPNSVTGIGYNAFLDTKWYKNQSNGILYLDNCCLGYKGDAPIGELAIKDGTRLIGNGAFFGCSGLTSVTIPNSVTSIGHSAFSNCIGLTSVTLPNSVTEIGSYAFSGCSGLTSVTLPNSVTSIGRNAFEGCTHLTEVNISGLSAWCKIDFGNYTGYSTTNPLSHAGHLKLNGTEITDLVIPDDITEIKTYAFYGCDGLISVTIPNSVTSINEAAFYGCYGITSVTIPNSVTSIGYYAFRGCTGLTSVTIPNSVTSIGNGAFENCRGLTSVTIGNSVTSIGVDAFDYCNLEAIVSLNPTPPSCYGYPSSFSDYSVATLYVPKDSYAKYYIDDEWGKFTNIKKIETLATSIALNKTSITLDENATDKIFATITPSNASVSHLAWTSDNPQVATVDYNGKVTAIKAGEATITAKTIDGTEVSASCKVIVKGVETIITLSQTEAQLSVNDIMTLSYTAVPATTTVEWSTSDANVAPIKVNSNGSVTVAGIANGVATITAKATDGSGASASCVVTVCVSGIEGVETNDNAVEVARYDVHGRLLSAPAKGINIVKYSDGTVKKIIHN